MLNRSRLLPPFLLENSTICELLNVCDQEIILFEKYVEKLRDELNIALADELLSRYEKIFDEIAFGTKQERIYKLLSKLNMTGTFRKIDVLNLVELITKREAQIIEHFNEYSFDVIVRLREVDTTGVLNVLIEQIEELKPAHLAFHVITWMELIRFKHFYYINLKSFTISIVHNNLGIKSHYLNGFYNLNGSYLLNQMYLSGLNIHDFEFSAKLKKQYHLDAHLTIDTMWRLNALDTLNGSRKLNADIRRSEV